MPTVPRPGMRPVYVELERDLADRLEAIAERNRRTLKAEITIAIEKHVGGDAPVVPAIVQGQTPRQVIAEPQEEEQEELPSTRGRYLLFLGEPRLRGRPRWAHFSWRGESFCLRDFVTGVIRRQDVALQARDVWRAASKRIPAVGEYFHPVGDWEWWKQKLEALSRE